MPSLDFCTLLHKSPNGHAVFGRWILKFAHVFNVPLPRLLRMFFFVFCFLLLEVRDPIRPKYLKTKNKKIYLAKKTKKTTLKARQGHITRACAKIEGLSLKNGLDIGL